MAKAKKKTITNKTTRGRKAGSRSLRGLRRGASAKRLSRIAVPLVVSACLLVGIVFFVMMGYQTAIASSFFNVSTVDIRGIDRVSTEDVRKIVVANTERTGVWRSDLSSIREKIEKLPFVKSASVSMLLPAGIRVTVTERVPQAIVRTPNGDYLVDGEGVFLAPAAKPEPNIPFPMRGWDESKTEKAMPGNLARLKLYNKMIDEWRSIGVVDRVREVNLEDARNPTAVIQDSGRAITVSLAKDELGKSLKSAVEAVAGKGEKVKAVNAGGIYPVLEYLAN